MKVFALDLSTKSTGYSIWEDGVLQLSGSLVPEAPGDYFFRILEMQEMIGVLIAASKPEIIAIEDYAFSRHSSSVTKLAELQGIVKKLAFDCGYRFGLGNAKSLLLIPITSWKKFCLGKGNLKKDQVMVKILSKYGKEFDDDNAADAFCVGKFVVSLMDYRANPGSFTKIEADVLKNFTGG